MTVFRSAVSYFVLFSLFQLPQINAEEVYEPIDVRSVKVQGLLGQRIEMTINNNLLALDADKDFLQPFRDRNRKGGYIGLGKLIDAMVRLATYSGNEKLLELKKHVVAETIKTQQADGYIGMFVPEMRVTKLWDVHEMSYLVLGLTTDYEFYGEKDSLQAAKKLGDYLIARLSADQQVKQGEGFITEHMAMTGIGSAMLALYDQTGDVRYLNFCTDFLHIPEWDYPIVLGRWGEIGGHAYTYISRCLAQLRIYQIQPDEKLLMRSHAVFDFLTKQDGLVITGACGDHECWHDTQSGTHNVGETCATAYLVRWLDCLIRLEGDHRQGDMMERSIYNALFAAQSLDGRKVRYYIPFDGQREYHKGDTYCCPSNYRRIIAELPGLIYYLFNSDEKAKTSKGVMINLYCESNAEVSLEKELSVKLRQETDYPNSGKVVIHVSPSKPASFAVRLRIPGWCSQGEVFVNANKHGTAQAGFYTVTRKWKSGDTITLSLPMQWRLVRGRKAQAGRVAVMRGPLLFCLDPSSQKGLNNTDLRLITLDPSSLEGPFADDTVRPNGLACKIRAWGAGAWYPQTKPNLELKLTEFPDPKGKHVYFLVPNPEDPKLVSDELVQPAAQ